MLVLISLTLKLASEMNVSGIFYDGVSSKAIDVEVDLSKPGFLIISGAGIQRSEVLSSCELSEPLGQMARHFTLPDLARVEITDLNSLSAWEKSTGRRGALNWVHHIESRWLWVMSFSAFLLAFIIAIYIWVLPLGAKWLAFKMPTSVAETASRQTMDAIVSLLEFKDSKLPEEQRARISGEFHRMVQEMHKGSTLRYRLLFFENPMPNAFALPNGQICITDSLVKMAENDLEVLGVLAHEIVHVREQHGMRSVLQNSAVFLIWTLMTGDVSSLAGMGSALPAMLAQSGYSRGFEQEADLGAADYMIQRGWGVKPLCDLLRKIDPEVASLKAAEALSTHPLTEKRIHRLLEHERKTNQKLEQR